MPLFTAKAYEANGTCVTESIDAANEQEAFRRLAARGLTVASLQLVERRRREREVRHPAEVAPSSSIFRRLKQEDVVVLCRQMALMVEAGVPILEALTSLEENAQHPTLHEAARTARVGISGGTNLSEALRQSPRVFPQYFCDMVQSAEEGGNLSAAMQTGADQMERALELRRKVVSAMVYPTLLLCIAIVVASILVVFVLPRFGKIFQNMGTPVPPTTHAMLAASVFLRGHWYYIAIGLVACIFGFKRLMRGRAFATAWTRLLMRIPLLGDILTKLAVSRAISVLSSMLSSNVPLLSALRHAARVSGNPVIEDAFQQAGSRVEGGRSLADSLNDFDVVPGVVTQMVGIGERTGGLPLVLGKTAAFFEDELENRLKSLTSVIEPVMIVALGVFIGFITLSVITPIYSLVGSVK